MALHFVLSLSFECLLLADWGSNKQFHQMHNFHADGAALRFMDLTAALLCIVMSYQRLIVTILVRRG